MPILELTPKEAETLKGILLVEKSDLEDLITEEENARDKKGLEAELKRVESMLNKLEK
jgi:hypothetical protein